MPWVSKEQTNAAFLMIESYEGLDGPFWQVVKKQKVR